MKTPPPTHIILAGLIIAALLTVPASARVVASNGTAFEYELNLDVSSVVGAAIAPTAPTLVKFVDDDTAKGAVFTIPVVDPTNLDLTAIDLKGNYGKYYGYDSTGVLTGSYITVYNPTMTLDAVLFASPTSSISGERVTKNTLIAFRVDAADVASYLAGVNAAQIRIDLTTPDGAVFYNIGGVSYDNIPITRARSYIGIDTWGTTGVDISSLETGTYTVKAEWRSPAGFKDYATDSNAVNFTIGTYSLGVESNRDDLVRGTPFVVTLSGEPKTSYFLYIKDASIVSYRYPYIKQGQSGVALISTAFTTGTDQAANTLANAERAYAGGTYVPCTAAIVTTDSAGSRVFEFGTNASTDDRTFTIKVVDPSDASKFRDIDVTVKEGDITVTAAGSGTYLPGDEITLSGINSDSGTVYLFMTGPNLDKNGVPLDDLSATAANGSYVTANVAADDTWTYCWDTGMYGSALPPGMYSIYAASTSMDDYAESICRENIWSTKYDTTSVLIQEPSISAQASATCIAAGDEVSIEGTATGSPETVVLWLFGSGGSIETCTLPVLADGSFLKIFDRNRTAAMDPGQYYAIVQHPMTDGAYAVRPDPANVPAGDFMIINATGAVLNLSGMTTSNAAFTVLEAIQESDSGDICAGAGFTVLTPEILMDEIGDADIDDLVWINGTTNLAAGDHLTIAVSSASVNRSTTLEVENIDGENGWSYALDTAGFEPGGYEVCVSGVEVDVSASSAFVIRGAPVPTLHLTPATATAFLSSTGEYDVVLSIAPEGLSGYNVTVSLDNASMGEITQVSFPSWSTLSLTGSLPTDSVWITGVDLNDQIVAGTTDVTLCTLTIRGDAVGGTGITLTPGMVDTDFGGRYAPGVENGTLEVITVVPFEKADGSAYPSPTDPDGDGRFEDLDGNGWIGFNDVVIYFNGMDFIENNEPIDAFDYDGSGFIGFNDVVCLFERI